MCTFLGQLLSYLEGEESISAAWVERLIKRAKPSEQIVYRTVLVPFSKPVCSLGKHRIVSASLCAEASRKACLSFANDNDLDTHNMDAVTTEITTPFVCLSHAEMLRILTMFDNIGYTKSQVIPRLKREKEVIVLNHKAINYKEVDRKEIT